MRYIPEECANVGKTEPPELSLTGSNTTTGAVASRLYSLRVWYLTDQAGSFSCCSQFVHSMPMVLLTHYDLYLKNKQNSFVIVASNNIAKQSDFIRWYVTVPHPHGASVEGLRSEPFGMKQKGRDRICLRNEWLTDQGVALALEGTGAQASMLRGKEMKGMWESVPHQWDEL
ncbi:hypothetical protein EVAR_33911_1 [Eumeta japonica]|uniref:Uncharacterized protein n=1 Tax=Eumeta variegata TaxID=151549 RepID=A0A4C1WJY8_EUMVA|nr:hypothetical protein EVAR_33911_1 [Eumeta japonica]